jgi:hypothetical protein
MRVVAMSSVIDVGHRLSSPYFEAHSLVQDLRWKQIIIDAICEGGGVSCKLFDRASRSEESKYTGNAHRNRCNGAARDSTSSRKVDSSLRIPIRMPEPNSMSRGLRRQPAGQ